MKKVMVTIIWGVNGFYIVDFLHENESYNSSYFCEHILYKLYAMKDDIWPESDEKKIWLHLDNCRVHNSKVTLAKTEEYGFKRTPHPAYSPDIALSAFFLFGYMKEMLKGSSFKSLDDLKERIHEILSKISREIRVSVFEEWIQRCELVIEQKGEYILKD